MFWTIVLAIILAPWIAFLAVCLLVLSIMLMIGIVYAIILVVQKALNSIKL